MGNKTQNNFPSNVSNENSSALVLRHSICLNM